MVKLLLEVDVKFVSVSGSSQNPFPLEVVVLVLFERGARGANFPSLLVLELFSFLLSEKLLLVIKVEVDSDPPEIFFLSFSIRSRN